MKRLCQIIGCWTLIFFPIFLPAQQASPWQAVEKNIGRMGEEKDGVFRVTFPRTDLRVKIERVEIRTGVALTSWAAFQKHGAAYMVMGDLVLLGGEVSRVSNRLTNGGIEVTAIHNHLIGEEPRIVYLHYYGHGDAGKMANTLREALEATATPTPAKMPVEAPPLAMEDAPKPNLDRLSEILGRKGTLRNGVASFSIARAEPLLMGTAMLGPRMGVATAINIQMANDGGAAASGDFVLLASEVAPVMKALQGNSIQVTALHNHMLDEQPRLFFMHFWGHLEETKLARGLRAALDATNHVKGQ
ncbi:MAG: DUF1259 domain-containing protein [Acidobacteria bacterium]|nr:DUF1259 domain-containing protein [Acidobacteriota bacterium]